MRTAALTTLGVLVLFALAWVPAVARAQLEAAVHLRTGFVPDPAELEGHATGSRAAAELAPHCTGFVGAGPNHVLALETRFGFLRLFATGPGDLVIAVRTSDDRWLCNEDRFGPHPSVEGIFPPGRAEVWVGLEQAGGASAYTLRITEMRSVRPGVGTDADAVRGAEVARDIGLEVAATEGLYEGTRLRRGFLPDPRWLEGVAGGPIDAGMLGRSCQGRITARPTHVIRLQTEFDDLQLYLQAEADQELTLLVLTPEGQFLCDGGARDVVEVSAPRWAQGVYRVWVGVLAEDTTVRHRLGISEIRRVR